MKNLTRNIVKEHLEEIFANFGKLEKVDLVLDEKVSARMHV